MAAETFRWQRRVEFCETDAAGIAHFSSFFLFMEQAEHAMLRSLGLSVIQELDGQIISWPRVSATCDYRSSARFEDVLDVTVTVTRLGRTSVTYGVEFHRGEQPIAAGQLVVVCCRIVHGQPPAPILVPSFIAEKLRPFVAAP